MSIVLMKRLLNSNDIPIPEYETLNSAGLDLAAAIENDIVLKPMERKLIPTGFSIGLPESYEAQIRPRSGLALKNGITVLNSPGTIDSDYRGEIGVILINLSDQDFTVTRGMRIAQMVISQYTRISWDVVEDLPVTVRGTGGFGSTGL